MKHKSASANVLMICDETTSICNCVIVFEEDGTSCQSTWALVEHLDGYFGLRSIIYCALGRRGKNVKRKKA